MLSLPSAAFCDIFQSDIISFEAAVKILADFRSIPKCVAGGILCLIPANEIGNITDTLGPFLR